MGTFLLTLTLSLLGATSRAERPTHWESHGPAYPFVDAVTAGQDDETAYAAAHDPSSGASGLFWTTDGGERWDRLAEAPPGETIRQVVIDPTDSQRLLALTTLELPFGTSSSRVYRSADGGATWRLTTTLPAASGNEDLFFDPARPDTAFLLDDDPPGSESGLLRSVGGDSWQQITPGSPATSAWITPGGALFWISSVQVCLRIPCYPGSPVYSETGLYTSADAGYAPSLVSVAGDACLPFTAAYAVTDSSTAYGPGPACADLLRSLDGGRTWSLWDPSGELSDALHGSTGRRLSRVAVDPSDSSILYALALAPANAEASVLLRSHDSGESWTALSSPGGALTSMAVGPSGTLYAGTSAGVFRARRTQSVPPRIR